MRRVALGGGMQSRRILQQGKSDVFQGFNVGKGAVWVFVEPEGFGGAVEARAFLDSMAKVAEAESLFNVDFAGEYKLRITKGKVGITISSFIPNASNPTISSLFATLSSKVSVP